MTSGTAPRPRVLVARSADRAAGLAGLLQRAGVDATAAPVIERAPVEDPAQVAALTAARERLAAGAYAWVAVTSVNAVDALLAETMSSAPSTRWACVGPATRRAIESHGLSVSLVPDGPMTAAGLVAAFPTAPERSSNRVLVPLGDLAADTLPDGLRGKGWEPDVVVVYRTVARKLPPDVVGQERKYDAVVVASGSAAREIAAQLGPQRVVAIGEPSAAAARDAGHDVAAVAARPTDDALASAVVHAITDAKERS